MLDQLLELFERDRSDHNRRSGTKRSLSSRLFGDNERQEDDDRDRQPDPSSAQPKRKPSKRERLSDLFEME
jgi:hypothetical protein